MAVRIIVSLFLIGFALTTLLGRSASALGRTFAAEENEPAASVTEVISGETSVTPDLPDATPSPTQNDLLVSEQTPDAAEQSPSQETEQPFAEPTETPVQELQAVEQTPVQEAGSVEFVGGQDGVQIRLSAELQELDVSDYTLSVSRITAESNASAFDPYRTLIEEVADPDQVDRFVVYELRYFASGAAMETPKSAANIELSDEALQILKEGDSVRVYCLVNDADSSDAKIYSAAAQIENGILSFASSVCPSAILVFDQPAANETLVPAETPDPETTEEPVLSFEYECDGLYVSGSPANNDVLPEDAVLSAERITSENYPERYAMYAAMLKEIYGTEAPIVFNAYDISFHVDGQEVEPVGDVVNVTIRDDAFTQTVEDPLVYHVVNEQSADPALQEIPAAEETSDGESQIAFSADSFSTFIVLADGSQIEISDTSGLTYQIIDTAAETFTNTSYYNASQKLGIAGNFHIVAFDTATLSAHTNGNVLAKNLYANSNFGTNGLADELSYVQNYMQVNGVSATSNDHVLAIGNTHDAVNVVTAVDNGNAFAISGTKLDRPKNLWQDQSTATLPFIDLAAVKADALSLSSSLAGRSDAYTESNLSTTGGSCDLSYLTLTDPDKVGFFNITAAQLAGYTYFGIKGFQTGHDGTVIINVDCTGASAITLPECRIYVDGTVVNFAEVTNFINGRVLWNLVNCSATVTTRLLYASLLAPNATVNIAQNMNGTVIGTNVTISAESHRDDFIGDLSNGVTVTANKVWSDYASGSPANTSVTLQLYRSTDGGATRTAYGTPVTIDSTAGWTYSWTELPTGSLYTVAETAVTQGSTDVTANYNATYSTQTGVSSGDITVSNQYLYSLPDTGGPGNGMFYALGVLLLLFVGLAALLRRFARRYSQ